MLWCAQIRDLEILFVSPSLGFHSVSLSLSYKNWYTLKQIEVSLLVSEFQICLKCKTLK